MKLFLVRVLRQMIHHPLTDAGIVRFREDWEAVQGAGRGQPARSDGRLVERSA